MSVEIETPERLPVGARRAFGKVLVAARDFVNERLYLRRFRPSLD